jgi:hypothetical protein
MLARRSACFTAIALITAGLVRSGQASANPSGGALPAPLTLEVFVGPDDGVPLDAVGIIVNVTMVSPLENGWTSAVDDVSIQTVPSADKPHGEIRHRLVSDADG